MTGATGPAGMAGMASHGRGNVMMAAGPRLLTRLAWGRISGATISGMGVT